MNTDLISKVNTEEIGCVIFAHCPFHSGGGNNPFAKTLILDPDGGKFCCEYCGKTGIMERKPDHAGNFVLYSIHGTRSKPVEPEESAKPTKTEKPKAAAKAKKAAKPKAKKAVKKAK